MIHGAHVHVLSAGKFCAASRVTLHYSRVGGFQGVVLKPGTGKWEIKNGNENLSARYRDAASGVRLGLVG